MQTPRWVTNQHRAAATLKLAAQLPPTVTAVAGVSRSGMSSAMQLAELLHLHPFSVSLGGKLTKLSHGSRFAKARPDDGLLAVVDDSVATGRSMAAIQRHRERIGRNVLWCVTFCTPEGARFVDEFAELLPLPHYLEWNFFNSVHVRHAAFDFDGVFCRDCTPREDDDGPRYKHFLKHAEPLYLPRRSTVPLVVTACLEKYRRPREAWLARWGVTVDRLLMGPWPTARARRAAYNAAAFKGRPFKNSACELFVESCPVQARAIAEESGKRVLCPPTGQIWN